MKSNNLIDKLTEEYKPVTPVIGQVKFVALYIFCSVALFLLAAVSMPIRENLIQQLSKYHFYYETLIWLMISLLSSIVTYRLLVPGLKFKKLLVINYSLVGLLSLLVFLRIPFSDFKAEFFHELNFSQGYCAPIITTMGLLLFYAIFNILKKGMLIHKRHFYINLGLALGTVGVLAMQIICAHESASHVFLWHYPPFIALIGFSSLFLREN